MNCATRRVGLWMIGAFGGVATTAAVGLAAIRRSIGDTSSMVTALPLFDGIDLDEPGQFVVGGHDIRRSHFRDTIREFQQRSGIFDRDLVEACLPDVDSWAENVRPGTILNTGATIGKLADRPDLPKADTPRGAVDRIQQDLHEFRDHHQLDQVVMINVASTEPPFELKEAHQSLDRLMNTKECRTAIGFCRPARFMPGPPSTWECPTLISLRRSGLRSPPFKNWQWRSTLQSAARMARLAKRF